MTDDKSDPDVPAGARRRARRLALAARRPARPVRDRRLRHRAGAGHTGSARRPRRPTTIPTSTSRYPHVDVELVSHDVGGVTDRDLRLARRISEIAAELGIAADPAGVQVLEIGLDTADRLGILPFWQALLGYDESSVYPGREILDPDGRRPTIWAQETDAHETPRQRWHFDVVVPIEQAQSRIDAALAAGGTLVSDEAAPSFVKGLELVTRITAAAEEANHHPDVDADLPAGRRRPAQPRRRRRDQPRHRTWPAGSPRSPPSSASRPAPRDVSDPRAGARRAATPPR